MGGLTIEDLLVGGEEGVYKVLERGERGEVGGKFVSYNMKRRSEKSEFIML